MSSTTTQKFKDIALLTQVCDLTMITRMLVMSKQLVPKVRGRHQPLLTVIQASFLTGIIGLKQRTSLALGHPCNR